MVLTEDDVIQILKIMNESTFDELHLKLGDMEMTLNKHGDLSSKTQALPLKGNADLAGDQDISIKTALNDHGLTDSVQISENHEIGRGVGEGIAEQGFIPIKSPMLGVFYEAPKPGESPFVELDSKIEKNTTVCTIEIMKLFSTIKAGVNGRIKRICAENGELVEHGQILFLVDPDTD